MPRSQESLQSSPSTENINPDINLDFEENFHFKKALFQKLIKDKSFFQEPKELNDLIKMVIHSKHFYQNKQI